ncbi:hypothetical protein AMAG_06025 [Allomyces macrogynus ATCC 38327]|uniref:Uncharacterized protein n=1 Tax=Allomyces macrogynus (strain ATCC 38327) TaxID=578462 RepID=A0A0L0SDU0_ALLM3|nr:hypothetical protein AMAG_06025 [Allomyces macrogynus ATCC 38327]|eukprot:KNE60651.1 hypothetical protein AMAG_06025 [Allomyces macrogynus ATCC 38327]
MRGPRLLLPRRHGTCLTCRLARAPDDDDEGDDDGSGTATPRPLTRTPARHGVVGAIKTAAADGQPRARVGGWVPLVGRGRSPRRCRRERERTPTRVRSSPAVTPVAHNDRA